MDYFSGAVYVLLDIPGQLFTPIATLARAAGWLAHVLEQRNRLHRPKCLYAGPEQQAYVLIDAREKK